MRTEEKRGLTGDLGSLLTTTHHQKSVKLVFSVGKETLKPLS